MTLSKPVARVFEVKYRATEGAKERVKQIYKTNSDKVLAIKLLSGGCQYCGWNVHPEILQFHHRDPNTKERLLGTLLAQSNFDKILKELEKCDLICPNCHMFKHYKREKFK